MKPITKTIIWLTIFSIAMGYMETAVVVYLRKIYYPGGFKFPLIPIDREIATTEFLREIATIIMLIGVGFFAGKNKLQRFAFFLFSFAVWDIFYYLFLKVLIGWPDSIFTWDILFLIPVPWVGPVIAPCIISLSMILLTLTVVRNQEKGIDVHLGFYRWLLLITGSLVVIISFVWDYFIYLSEQKEKTVAWTLGSNTEMFEEVQKYIPQHFNWGVFWIGEGMILFVIFCLWKKYKIAIK
jgi:hypothetical protein